MQPCHWSSAALLCEAEQAAASLTPPHIIASLGEHHHPLLSAWIFLFCYTEESFLRPDKNQVEKEDPEGLW